RRKRPTGRRKGRRHRGRGRGRGRGGSRGRGHRHEGVRDADIGGTVELLVHVSEDGEVTRVEVGTSSGHPALDRAALRVAHVLEMSPALNRDRRVAVLTRVPIVFRVR
ncbi:MAG: energy transducer TonB, partial [Gemmatimonadetes bacterium]|nr:energy transducer TonB [Gemmatimonadota bacterium]